MRLIDADKLLERMKKGMESGSNLNGTFDLYIEHAPTVKPTGDLISRQDAIDALCSKCRQSKPCMKHGQKCDEVKAIESLPSADAVQIPIKLEKRYPQSRDEDITDAFMRGYLAGRSSADRQTVDKEYLVDLIQEAVYDGEACAKLMDLADRPTGEWIIHDEVKNIYGGIYIECSECGTRFVTQTLEDEHFCRNCGCWMIQKRRG